MSEIPSTTLQLYDAGSQAALFEAALKSVVTTEVVTSAEADLQQAIEVPEAKQPAIIAEIGGVGCLAAFVTDSKGRTHWASNGWFVKAADLEKYGFEERIAQRRLAYVQRMRSAESRKLRSAAANLGITGALDAIEAVGEYAPGAEPDERGAASSAVVFGTREPSSRTVHPVSSLDAAVAAWQRNPKARLTGRRRSTTQVSSTPSNPRT